MKDKILNFCAWFFLIIGLTLFIFGYLLIFYISYFKLQTNISLFVINIIALLVSAFLPYITFKSFKCFDENIKNIFIPSIIFNIIYLIIILYVLKYLNEINLIWYLILIPLVYNTTHLIIFVTCNIKC